MRSWRARSADLTRAPQSGFAALQLLQTVLTFKVKTQPLRPLEVVMSRCFVPSSRTRDTALCRWSLPLVETQ